MSQFAHYSNFKFKNIDSERYQLYIVNTESTETDRKYGVTSKLEIDDSYQIPLFKAKTKERNSFDIEFTRASQDLEYPLPMPEEYKDEILAWLEYDEPQPLEVNGILYYGCFTNYQGWDNHNLMGVMKFTFEMSDYYAYTPVDINTYDLIHKNYMYIDLANKSNIRKDAPLDIVFKANEDGDFKITNNRNGQVYIQKDVLKNEIIRIYGETHEVVCLNNENKNVFKNKDGDWIKLSYGINRLKLEGHGIFTIEYQTPLGLR